jgi:hypothetical protein
MTGGSRLCLLLAWLAWSALKALLLNPLQFCFGLRSALRLLGPASCAVFKQFGYLVVALLEEENFFCRSGGLSYEADHPSEREGVAYFVVCCENAWRRVAVAFSDDDVFNGGFRDGFLLHVLYCLVNSI